MRVLTPPVGLSEDTLAIALHREWKIDVATMAYRAVGFGSHHWEVLGSDGQRWFAGVDELELKRHTMGERFEVTLAHLTASLGAACALQEAGCEFVVAPIRTGEGAPATQVGERFAAAVYPFADGECFSWGPFPSTEHRQALLDMLVRVHTAPARHHAERDDFGLPHRDTLETGLSSPLADVGPYSGRVNDLLAANTDAVAGFLARYDRMVAAAQAQATSMVLTHGEPHPGNTMRTVDGWRLIDWDTALVAPCERDLWTLDPGDGSILAAYAQATGVTPRAELLELYRLRWDLADIAVDVDRFARPHTGSADDEKTFRILGDIINRNIGEIT